MQWDDTALQDLETPPKLKPCITSGLAWMNLRRDGGRFGQDFLLLWFSSLGRVLFRCFLIFCAIPCRQRCGGRERCRSLFAQLTSLNARFKYLVPKYIEIGGFPLFIVLMVQRPQRAVQVSLVLMRLNQVKPKRGMDILRIGFSSPRTVRVRFMMLGRRTPRKVGLKLLPDWIIYPYLSD